MNINIKINNRLKKRTIITLLSTFIFGFMAHGMGLFNLYAYFDNADLFNIGATYESGRWFLGFLSWLTMYVTGSSLYSTPLFNGLLTLFFIACINILNIDLFDIKSNILIFLFCGIVVIFPTTTSSFGYMFFAPYIYFALLLGVFGIYIFNKYRKWYVYIACGFLLSCGIGVYQANIPFFVGILLLLTIKRIYENKSKSFISECLINGGMCILMMAFYFGINFIELKIHNVVMVSYKGLNNFGGSTLIDYINRIIPAYLEFLNPTNNVSRNMYPFSLIKFYKLLLIVLLIVSFVYLKKCFKESRKKGLELLFLIILIPLASNFIYIMCDVSIIYSMMMSGEIIVFITLIYLLDNITEENNINNLLKCFSFLILIIFNFLYIKFDNDCYLKANVLQTQAHSYFTTLVTQIKNTEGYTNGLKICYVNIDKIQDSSIPEVEEFDEIKIYPYHFRSLVEDYNYRKFITRQLGFNLEVVKIENIDINNELKEMPSYPNNGSIKIIDDIIVVKFAD